MFPLMTKGVLEGFLKGDRCRYDDGSVRNLLQSTVAAVAIDITLLEKEKAIRRFLCRVQLRCFCYDTLYYS